MKKLTTLILSLTFIVSISITSYCAIKKKYYAKFMPVDYSNWIWEELPNVISCEKTKDGLQYIIKYKGTPTPLIRTGKSVYKQEEAKNLTMTIGVDNILIFEYEE